VAPSSPATQVAASTATAMPSTGVVAFRLTAPVTTGLHWAVLDHNSTVTNSSMQCVAKTVGFNSGRHGTITSIDSSGQAPDSLGASWRISIDLES
jgi:hypothetical protein